MVVVLEGKGRGLFIVHEGREELGLGLGLGDIIMLGFELLLSNTP